MFYVTTGTPPTCTQSYWGKCSGSVSVYHTHHIIFHRHHRAERHRRSPWVLGPLGAASYRKTIEYFLTVPPSPDDAQGPPPPAVYAYSCKVNDNK